MSAGAEETARGPAAGSGEPAAEGRRRDRRWWATRVGIPVVVLAALGIGLGIAFSGGSGGSDAAAAPTTTVVVTRRNLVDRESISGTLGYADARNLAAGASGTLTQVPAEGALRTRGQVLYRVDTSPVVLMYGSLPVYRALSDGDTGQDVLQLERNLEALGYTDNGSLTVDGTFDGATAAAVEEWQTALGVDETGQVEMGRIVFLPGARRVGTVKADVGDSVRNGQVIMQTTGTARSVTVPVDAREADIVTKGDTERVELPDGRTVNATVTDVGKVATASSDGTTSTINVTLALDGSKGVTDLDSAPVTVDLTKDTAKNVLAVPVTALLALQGGGFGLERVNRDGSTSIVAVGTGTSSDGYVEVTGNAIAAGTRVKAADGE